MTDIPEEIKAKIDTAINQNKWFDMYDLYIHCVGCSWTEEANRISAAMEKAAQEVEAQ